MFDRLLPREIQAASDTFWTPLATTRIIARWFDSLGVRTVVDIGSGAGKFCVAAALFGGCRVVGLEHRPRLVAAARALARDLGVEDRVHFVQGTLGRTDIPSVDAYYFYNPFGENFSSPAGRLDQDVELSPERYTRDLALALRLIANARMGTCVVTYHGLGARIPHAYDELDCGWNADIRLRLWRKVRER